MVSILQIGELTKGIAPIKLVTFRIGAADRTSIYQWVAEQKLGPRISDMNRKMSIIVIGVLCEGADHALVW
jgi:hypothetical protein